ncbi:MAG: hypothetical protein KDD62_02655, partial [Bdellovibrionales bacterium]|nr:hypothetical protein [Bdellovibrionales bacterium]
MKRSYAFILPRCGEEVVGGMETLTGQLAGYLSARGDRVEIWATCAKDNRTWENEWEPGVGREFGVLTRRFPVDARDLEVWIPKQISIAEGMNLPIEDQLDWMQESVNSKALYEHIALHADDFDALFFVPYLFGTTFWGSLIRPDKSYLIPCLHDESYAYTDVAHAMFQRVSGALFNAGPEQELAERLYGTVRGGEVGMGFVPFDVQYVEALEPLASLDFPYLL